MVVTLPFISYHKITGRYKAERLEKDYPIQVVGRIVDEITDEKDLIIGIVWGGPEILYYSDRRGWSLGATNCTVDRVENLRRQGADYFVTTTQNIIDSSVINYLKNKYEVIRSTNEYLILKL